MIFKHKPSTNEMLILLRVQFRNIQSFSFWLKLVPEKVLCSLNRSSFKSLFFVLIVQLSYLC